MRWSPGFVRSIVTSSLLMVLAGAGAADKHHSAARAIKRSTPAADAALLKSLAARLEALEQRLAALESVPSAAASRPPSMSVPETPGMQRLSRPSLHTARPASDMPGASEDPPGEDLSRALERALVREGGLVLPRGVFELEPRLRYQHRSTNRLEIVSLAGQPQVSQVDRKLDLLQVGLGIRIGMPWSMQLEAFVPYASNRERIAAIGGVAGTETASGFGNVEIGVTRQLFMQPGGLGLLGSLRWVGQDAASQFGSTVATGSSFSSLQGSLLFVTRRDPVVFFGGVSHAINRERRIAGSLVDPGDTSGLRIGSIIALSPDTSLRFGLDVSRSRDTRLDSAAVAGSGSVLAEFSAGFSFALTPRTLLGIEAGIGLTPGSPDFRIGLSLPVRY